LADSPGLQVRLYVAGIQVGDAHQEPGTRERPQLPQTKPVLETTSLYKDSVMFVFFILYFLLFVPGVGAEKDSSRKDQRIRKTL